MASPRYISWLILLAGPFAGLMAQPASYQDDVDALFRMLQKTPAYKDQIQGVEKDAYVALYRSVRNDTAPPNGYFYDYHKLARLLFPLRDNHFGFNQQPAAILRKEFFTNPDSVRQFRNSPYYRFYPCTQLDLDSLEQALGKKHKDSIDGGLSLRALSFGWPLP